MRSKEKYMSIPDDRVIHCDFCEGDYPKIKFGIRGLKENGTNGKCLYCDWLKRHKNVLPSIPNWEDEEIKTLLKFLLLDESPYLNDLIDNYGMQHNLQEICKASSILHVNKQTLVQVKCECCGKPIDKFPSVFLRDTDCYCSEACYLSDKTNKISKGEESPFYNRVTTNCSNCGNEIYIIPHNYKKTNSDGDSFHFCSKECYWNFRSTHYVGEKASMYGKTFNEETRNKCRIKLVERMKNDNRLNTKIQLEVNQFLNDLSIKFEREKSFVYYSVDNYLPEHNLVIEVMGDYWHSSPIFYNREHTINGMQSKGIIKDKQKHSYLKNQFQIEVLYLWENDIKKEPDKCKKLIKSYIDNKGILQNYHSFNYNFYNNKLEVQSNIIIPYQDMEINEYRDLIETA